MIEQDPKEHIRRRAYEIWEGEGRPDGSQDADWRRAEAELTGNTPAKATPRQPAAQAQTRKPAARKSKP